MQTNNASPVQTLNEQFLKHLVKTFQNQPITTSRKIADVFGKSHYNVLRDIQNLIEQVMTFDEFSQLKSESANFNQLKSELVGLSKREVHLTDSQRFIFENFFRVTYKDRKGEQRTEYKLTKDGFTMVVMGYTGAKAIEFKVAYIARFNEMEQKLKEQKQTEYLKANGVPESKGFCKADQYDGRF